MKKLLLFAGALIMLSACAKDDGDMPPSKGQNPESEYVPCLYGVGTVEDDQPSTRGVANIDKQWSRTYAEKRLTVKFMVSEDEYMSDPRYREWIDLVKDVSKEWEACCGIKFHFQRLFSQEDAMIRIRFANHRRDLHTSYSYTGTDNKKMFKKQNEATMVFAQWSDLGINRKRGDILRAFGQVIGLELEHRHPEKEARWIDDIAELEDYWRFHLAKFIDWEEIQTYIIEPIQRRDPDYEYTRQYDQESVMNWPFLEQMIKNIPPLPSGDEGHIADISPNDRAFVHELYGDPIPAIPPHYVVLAEFTYTGTKPTFTFDTTEDVFVIWDQDIKKDLATFYYMPEDTTRVKRFKAEYIYDKAETRKIRLCQLEDKLVDRKNSNALLDFSIYMDSTAKDIDIKNNNLALQRIFIEGGTDKFTPQTFNFSDFQQLKELYLVQVLDSEIYVDACHELEIVSTSRSLYYPKSMTNPPSFSPSKNAVIVPGDSWPWIPYPIKRWPDVAEWYHSLKGNGDTSLQLLTCENIKAISLENTRLKNFNFNKFENLEYVYLSSTDDYLACGPDGSGPPYYYYAYPYAIGMYLEQTIATLPSRSGRAQGNIIVRNVEKPDSNKRLPYYYSFIPVRLYSGRFENINRNVENKNWNLVWDSGYNLLYPISVQQEE